MIPYTQLYPAVDKPQCAKNVKKYQLSYIYKKSLQQLSIDQHRAVPDLALELLFHMVTTQKFKLVYSSDDW